MNAKTRFRLGQLAILLACSLSFASDYYEDEDGNRWVKPPTDAEFRDAWNSGTRYQTGPAYNKIGEPPSAFTHDVLEYIKDIAYAGMVNYGQEPLPKRPPAPELDRSGRISDYENDIVSGRIHFVLFEGNAPNAFAGELQNSSTVRSSSGAKLTPYDTYKQLFGAAGERYFTGYVVGLVDAMLRLNLTEGELAFVIAHELGHIRNGDTDRGGGHDRELLADNAALDAIAGRYPLTAALSLWHKLHAWETANRPNDRLKRLGESFVSSHPDSGARYTNMQKKIEELRAAGRDKAKADRPLKIDVAMLNPNPRAFDRAPGIKDEKKLNEFLTKAFAPDFVDHVLTPEEAGVESGLGMVITPVWKWADSELKIYSPENIDHVLTRWMETAESSQVNWNSAKKVNQFIKICTLMYRHRDKLWSAKNSALHQRIVEFLARHTGDRPDQFNTSTFLPPLQTAKDAYRNSVGEFMRHFWLNSANASADASSALTRLRPQWHVLFAKVSVRSIGDLYSALAELTREEKALAEPFAAVLPGILKAQEAEFLTEEPGMKIGEVISTVSLLTANVDLLKELKFPDWNLLEPQRNLDLLAGRLAKSRKKLSLGEWDAVMNIHARLPFSASQLEPIIAKFRKDLPKILAQPTEELIRDQRYSLGVGVAQFANQAATRISPIDLILYLDVGTRDSNLGREAVAALKPLLQRVTAREISDRVGHVSPEDRSRWQSLLASPTNKRLEWEDQRFLRVVANRILSRLGFLGARTLHIPRTVDEFSHDDLLTLMAEFRLSQSAHERAGNGTLELPPEGALFILQLILRHSDHYASKEKMIADLATVSAALKDLANWMNIPAETRDQFSADLSRKLDGASVENLKTFLFARNAPHLLGDRALGEWVGRYVHLVSKQSASVHKTSEDLLYELDKEQSLSQTRRQAWTIAQNRAAEMNQAQPADTKHYGSSYRPLLVRGDDILIRLGSEVAGQLRALPDRELFVALDYLMGHSDQPPKLDDKRELVLRELRTRLLGADTSVRVIAANILLTGPDGVVFKNSGLAALMEQTLAALPTGPRRELGRSVLEAMVEMEDLNRSLAFALVKGQPPSIMRGSSPEIAFLKGFGLATGVPGGKMFQYLAYTNAFSEFSEAFEDFQDQAFPMSYIEMLNEAEAAVGYKWLEKNRILGVTGFGTVNVAVYYESPERPGEVRVLKFLRRNVVSKTKLDFDRMAQLLQILRRRFPDNREFQAINGLLPLIRRSLDKEFSQAHVLQINALTSQIYNTSRRGIRIRALPVDAAVSDTAVEMAQGKGISAKDLKKQDLATYNKYMAAFLELERDVLLGTVRARDGRGIANPDFHNGQLKIDLAEKQINLIDMSQSSIITDAERAQAIALLRVMSNLYSLDKAQAIIKQYFAVDIPKEELRLTLRSSSRMDIFVHLIAAIELKGTSVPTATADWIMAFDRWLAMGKAIGWNEADLIKPFLDTQGGSWLLSLREGFESMQSYLFGNRAQPKPKCADNLRP